jgi:2-polyprenyl-3-methyl-5-hydroxy-6-metoxy-1,4-benzoquinol methylase
MFYKLENINDRPKPFAYYSAADLWTDDHISRKMLEFHLNEAADVSSRNTEFIDRSVDWIVYQFGVQEGSKIADFGCGPGLYTTRFATRKADVTGIDFSPRSIQYAQNVAVENGLNIRYLNQDYLDYETENRFDLIVMIMCDFCALSPNQRSKLVKKFYTLLYPGGSILLDVFSWEAFNLRKEEAVYEKNMLGGFWSANSYYGFLNTFKYKKEKVVLDKYTVVEENRTRTFYNWLQYFSPESLGRELKASGFEVQGTYANVAGALFSPNTNEFAVIARKK